MEAINKSTYIAPVIEVDDVISDVDVELGSQSASRHG
jgi:hypothetical protein